MSKQSLSYWAGVILIAFNGLWAPPADAACGCGSSVPCTGSCESTLFGNVCTWCGYIQEGGPCGATSGNATRSCESGTSCSAPFGSGTCVGGKASGESCTGLGQGNCQDGLVCDIIGECRHNPPTNGEPCGTGVNCASGYTCSSTVGGRCEAQKQAGESCSLVITNQCAGDLVCDAIGECRHSPPERDEPCGTGVTCASGLTCSSVAGGRCQSQGQAGDYCNLLIPNQCADDLVCDAVQSECRHDPSQLGEPCGPFVQCTDDLFCPGLLDNTQPFKCATKRTIGEACVTSAACRDSLQCRDCWLDGCPSGRACFPQEGHEVWPPELCLALHSPELHASAIRDGVTVSFGGGSNAAIAISGTDEIGNVYGSDGSYGCYLTTCYGFETSIGISDFIGAGLYTSYDNFRGTSNVLGEQAGIGEFFSFGTSQVFNLNWALIGTADVMSFGIGFAPPLSGGYFECNTVVDTVGRLATLSDAASLAAIENATPFAVCAQGLEACADVSVCSTDVNVDAGSYDPDGESVFVLQAPAGPYGLGAHAVILSATDPDGASSSCSTEFNVNDCIPPTLSCPPALVAECTGPDGAPVEFEATASDVCSPGVVAECIPESGSVFALGPSPLGCSAADAAGNLSQCVSSVRVVDTTAPALSCNAPSTLTPPAFPASFAGSAADICDAALPAPTIIASSCTKAKKNGRVVDVTDDCGLSTAGSSITIADGAGVGTRISWTLEATDASGNRSQRNCTIDVVNPGRASAAP